jgi:hypothetical protein
MVDVQAFRNRLPMQPLPCKAMPSHTGGNVATFDAGVPVTITKSLSNLPALISS